LQDLTPAPDPVLPSYDRVPDRELGADWSGRRYSPEHRARRVVRQLEALGLKVTVEAAA
jgi:hypothetical protein